MHGHSGIARRFPRDSGTAGADAIQGQDSPGRRRHGLWRRRARRSAGSRRRYDGPLAFPREIAGSGATRRVVVAAVSGPGPLHGRPGALADLLRRRRPGVPDRSEHGRYLTGCDLRHGLAPVKGERVVRESLPPPSRDRRPDLPPPRMQLDGSLRRGLGRRKSAAPGTASRAGGAAGPVRAAGPACRSLPESVRTPGSGAIVQGIRPTHPRLTSTADPGP